MNHTITDQLVESWWQRAWARAKCWHRIRLGPVSLLIRLARSGPRPKGRRVRVATRKFLETVSGKNRAYHSTATESPIPRGLVEDQTELGAVLIAGVGRSFGTAAAHLYAERASSVSLVARGAERLQGITRQIVDRGLKADAYACDLTHEHDVERLVSEIVEKHGVPELCIYAVENFCPGDVLHTRVAAFEEAWRANCLGAFIVGRAVGRLMAQRRSGTVIFMGGTSSILGRAGYLNLAVGKHGLRALAHVMARELGPRGVHVAHCIVDGEVSGDDTDTSAMNPVHVAREILRVHLQPSDCWTTEMDLRPAGARYWEHC
jgi:NAD(P)-dependent dehydrogenase (short-subunit alcohol dehydrogenase family)